MWYIIEKEQPPTRWLTRSKIEIPPVPVKFRVVFLCLKHYLINVNTNVSNAKMNIPKAMRSLKSKSCFLLSISTTPILCKNRGQPPCNTAVPYRQYSIFRQKIIVPVCRIQAVHQMHAVVLNGGCNAVIGSYSRLNVSLGQRGSDSVRGFQLIL